MSNYFTKTGDDGTSGILGEGRLRKDDPRIEAIGAIDEANSTLGIARAICKQQVTRDVIITIQRDLYKLMSELSATPENAVRFRTIDSERVRWLEVQTNSMGDMLDIPNEFIIPGDTLIGGVLDLARTIVRRAERRVSTLYHQDLLENKTILQYLNRLSSFCFVLELYETLSENDSQVSLAKSKKP